MSSLCRLFTLWVILSTLCLIAAAPARAQGFDWSNLQPGHWYEIPNTHLFDVAPNPCVHENCNKVGNVIAAWSGGAYDTTRDWYIVWGGGHADYGGNEIYAFDVNSLNWIRVNDPSYDLGGDPDSGVYPDGTPRSVHTYGYITYVPNIDRFCTIGAATLYPSGNATTDKVHCNDFDNPNSPLRGWELRTTMPHEGKLGARAAYDSSTGHVWYNGYGSRDYLMQWDPINNVWSVRTPLQSASGTKLSAAIDPTRGVFVDIGEGVTPGYYNIHDSGTLSKIDLNATGPTNIQGAKAPGFEYDPVSDQFIGWAGGTSVYALDFDAREWKECPAAGTNSASPGPQVSAGTYGRFQYIPSKNAFIIVNSVNANVFVYKLSNVCGGGPPDTTPPSTPQGLQASATGPDTIDLTWQASTDPETGVPSYRVYRDGANVGQVGVTSFTDSGLSDSTSYTYTVSALNGTGLESPQSGSASATTAADATPPTVVSVDARGNPNQVTVVFSESVEPTSASTASNYSIDNGVTVSGASLASDGMTVTLTTSTLVEGVNYTLTVNNVRDLATNPNTIAPGTTVSFDYLNIQTVEVRIASGNDDVEEDQTGLVGLTSSDLEMSENGPDDQTIGLRFPQLAVPQGATIVTAYVQFKVDEVNTAASSLVIRGEASDDAAPFSTASGDVTSRAQTISSTPWAAAPWPTAGVEGPDQRTPNIAAVIQEIVNRPGWAAGGSLALFISGTGTRTAEAHNGDAAGAPMLHVEYSTSPPTDPPQPPGGLQVE